MEVTVCIGSSCYIKGAAEIVELLKQAVAENHLEDDITVAGSFCIGKCNRIGVTVQVDGKIHTGVTCESFEEFFKNNVLSLLENERK